MQRKTLPSCPGLCQVARSPQECSQAKEGDQGEETEQTGQRRQPEGLGVGRGEAMALKSKRWVPGYLGPVQLTFQNYPELSGTIQTFGISGGA